MLPRFLVFLSTYKLFFTNKTRHSFFLSYDFYGEFFTLHVNRYFSLLIQETFRYITRDSEIQIVNEFNDSCNTDAHIHTYLHKKEIVRYYKFNNLTPQVKKV